MNYSNADEMYLVVTQPQFRCVVGLSLPTCCQLIMSACYLRGKKERLFIPLLKRNEECTVFRSQISWKQEDAHFSPLF